MRKIISVGMAIVMLFSVIAFSGCDQNPNSGRVRGVTGARYSARFILDPCWFPNRIKVFSAIDDLETIDIEGLEDLGIKHDWNSFFHSYLLIVIPIYDIARGRAYEVNEVRFSNSVLKIDFRAFIPSYYMEFERGSCRRGLVNSWTVAIQISRISPSIELQVTVDGVNSVVIINEI